ncbi:MAG: FeoC-like transcriptional regulator [Candidatus Thorarchaeota archaeon]
MLKKILQLLLAQNLLYKGEIAENVGVQNTTLDDMLRILLQRGFLRVGDCETQHQSSCSSCPSASGCESQIDAGRAYFVTEKGKRYAES